jgi:hypothetical protein
MTKKEFIALVISEIENIKQKATAEEIGKLNFYHLLPMYKTDCIYGQMTGNCYSARAKELKQNRFQDVPDYDYTYTEAKKKFMVRGDNFSALEVYIVLKDSKNKEVIQYLKGEINELPKL